MSDYKIIADLANRGNLPSQFALGALYYFGHGVEQDFECAFDWFQKAAMSGFCTAQYALGLMYREGRGADQNKELAVHWIRQAAEKCLPEAQGEILQINSNVDPMDPVSGDASDWLSLAFKKAYDFVFYNFG